VEARGLGDVGDDGAFDGHAGLETLADEIGEIYGGVYADWGKGGAGIAVWREGGFGKDAELGVLVVVSEDDRNRHCQADGFDGKNVSLEQEKSNTAMVVPEYRPTKKRVRDTLIVVQEDREIWNDEEIKTARNWKPRRVRTQANYINRIARRHCAVPPIMVTHIW
jgi:hypothetical protein